MDIEGTIIFDLPLQEGVSKSTNNPWKKKEWVLETFGNYPKKVKFTVFGERRVNEMNFEIGKAYKVSVDVESREYNGRWYTDLMAYACTPIEGGMNLGGQPQSSSTAPFNNAAPAAQTPFGIANEGSQMNVEDPFASSNNDTDDLPF